MIRISIVIAVLAVAVPVAADTKSDYLQRADAAYKAGRYDDALEALNKAYAVDSDPQVIFAIGQVHMKQGDCKKAIADYQRFLATKPDAHDAAIANKAITHCNAMKPEPAPAPPAATEPEPPTPAAASPPPEPEQPTTEHVPWYRDWLGNALVLGGVAAGAVSAIEYRSALAHRDSADAGSYANYGGELDAAHRDQNIAIGLAAGAGVLVTAGFLHYALRDATRERSSVSLAPTRGGAIAAWSTRF